MSRAVVAWRTLKFDLKNNSKLQTDVEIASESMYDLYVNGKLYVTVVLSPTQIKEWTIGFLYSEGLIDSVRRLKRVNINDDSIEVKTIETDTFEKRSLQIGRYLPDSCASTISMRRISFIKKISNEIFSNTLIVPKDMVKRISVLLNKASKTYRITGGTHSAALFNDEGKICFFSEDVGRHNAVDKVIGASLLNNIRLDDKILAVSGRLSGDLVFKCARARIPILISLSAPLSRGVELAEMAGITLIGFARGNRFNIYAHPQRIQ
ncbi:MAG TPA: formate dehydrogenase accessory sulfurtransferase FdhD [Candidatus Korarchaeota archaeon]|nr:formate dehydrogenase accessory sulfurtransferase FdhD [Candidatus Korarchaeota archaeon]